MSRAFRLGIVVNPFAGIGGALALKGSDGADIRQRALDAGAVKRANEKLQFALSATGDVLSSAQVFTASGEMGETTCIDAGLNPTVVYKPKAEQTEAEDTEKAVVELLNQDIDLLVFVGGDGTARNVCNRVVDRAPVIGVPAGCKIHSGVFAVTPSAAGKLIAQMIEGELVSEFTSEVRDIDETQFRNGKVIAKHYGEMRVPQALTYIQAVKMGGQESDELVLEEMIDDLMEFIDDHPDDLFVMGSGSTVAAVMSRLGADNTLLGVDVVRNGEVIMQDVTAVQLETLSESQGQTIWVVITVIGGQGHIFGRGNQQLSPTFIKRIGKNQLLIMASKRKLASLQGRPLRADTGDPELDKALQGPTSIISGYHDRVLYPLA